MTSGEDMNNGKHRGEKSLIAAMAWQKLGSCEFAAWKISSASSVVKLPFRLLAR
jgi:hypothetical protein